MIGPTRDEMWLMEKCPKFQLLMVFTTHIHVHQGQHVRVVWVQAAADSYKCNLMLATTNRFSMLRLGLGGNSSVLNIPSYNRFSVYHYANAIKHESTNEMRSMRWDPVKKKDTKWWRNWACQAAFLENMNRWIWLGPLSYFQLSAQHQLPWPLYSLHPLQSHTLWMDSPLFSLLFSTDQIMWSACKVFHGNN